MTNRDIAEFRAYLRGCTDSQVIGVLEKEREAGRQDYVILAVAEYERRALTRLSHLKHL